MILARDLHQILLSIQEKEDIQISNEEDALVSVEIFLNQSLSNRGCRSIAHGDILFIDSVTQRQHLFEIV